MTPGSSKSGTVSVIYTIQDATNDPNRRVQGRITVIVKDVPDAPSISVSRTAAKKIFVIVQGSPASNGSPITDHTVKWSGGADRICAPGAECEFDTTNGTPYTFTAYANNAVGESQPSNSVTATSYGQPGAPTGLRLSGRGDATTTLDASWNRPGDDGGSITRYEYRIMKGGSTFKGEAVGGTTAAAGSADAGTYQLYVKACGEGGCGPESGPVETTVNNPPPPKPSGSLSKTGPAIACQSGGFGCHQVKVSYDNVPNGNYDVEIRRNGSAVGSTSNVNASGSGSFTHNNHLGVMPAGETITAFFRNTATGETFSIGSTSAAEWNAM